MTKSLIYSNHISRNSIFFFKDSEEAKKYREERNSKLPYIDFNNLPEVLDDVLLEEIMPYKKDRYLRRMIHDLLSEEQNYQITQHERKDRELITKEEIKRVDEAFEKKRNERKFNGNLREPSTVDEYILRYGVDPRTGQPETIENFYKKYTMDPKTGMPVPKEKNE